MYDNSDLTKLSEQNLIDTDKYGINGYKIIKNIATGSLWNVFIAENNGIKIIIKQINQMKIQGDEDKKKDIIYNQIRAYRHFNELKRDNKLDFDVFYQFLGISFENIEGDKIKCPIIIQNYAKNQSLDNILKKAAKNPKLLNNTRKMIIIYGLAKRMKTLHKNDLTHGNLKPSKILIDENYYPYINDIGSKMPDINNNNRFDVSYLYAAPEALNVNGIELSEKSDVFSFGMIVYQLLTGKKPYEDTPNVNIHEIQLCMKRKIQFEISDNIPSFLRYLISLTIRYDKDERPTFKLIMDYFNRGIIFPSILKNLKANTEFIHYMGTYSKSNKFYLNPPDMIKRFQTKLDNVTFSTVVNFFLADYYNDLESQKQIGNYYYNGDILPKDINSALKYYQKAQEQEDAESFFYVGQIYYNNKNLKIFNSREIASYYAWKCIIKSSQLGFNQATEFINNNTNYFQIDKSKIPVVLLTGRYATGKTTFVNKLVNEFDNRDVVSTLVVDYYNVLHIENDESYVFQIRDSMDMDRFGKILPLSCRDVSVCIIMYDVTNKSTFDSIDDYYSQLNEYCDNPKFILIGNKIDLQPVSISTEEGRQKAHDLNAEFLEVSNKSYTNIFNARSKIANIANNAVVKTSYGGKIEVIKTYEKPKECNC